MATGRIGTTPVLQVRWSKAPSAGTTSLSGLDDNSVSLVYSVGYEAVYRNGVLLSRTNDYTATDGTTVTLIDATIAGDIIEIFANQLVPLTDAISKGQFTAKAALLSATAASTPAVLTVGANDTVLTADSSTATGLKWATPASGGMTSIASGTLSGASVSLTSIVGTYKDLVLVMRDFYGSAEDSVKFRYNNDSTANRYKQAATSASNQSFDDDAHRFCTAGIDNAVSNAITVLEIYDYANTTHWKSHRVLTFTNNATTTTNYDSFISAGVYNQDTAISRIDMFPTSGTFTAGTYVLYGVN